MLKIYQPSLSQEWSLSMVEKETREECYEILKLVYIAIISILIICVTKLY